MSTLSKATQESRDRINQILMRHGRKKQPVRTKKTIPLVAEDTAQHNVEATQDTQEAEDPLVTLAASVEHEILDVFESYPQHSGTAHIVTDTLRHILEAIAELRELKNVLVKLFVHAVNQVAVSRGMHCSVFGVQNLRVKLCEIVSRVIEQQDWEQTVILEGSGTPRALIRSSKDIAVFSAILKAIRSVMRKLDGSPNDTSSALLKSAETSSAAEKMARKGMAVYEKTWNSMWHHKAMESQQSQSASASTTSRSQSPSVSTLEASGAKDRPPLKLILKRKALSSSQRTLEDDLNAKELPPPKRSRRIIEGGGIKWTDAETLALLKLANTKEFRETGLSGRAVLHKRWTDENEPEHAKQRSGNAIGQHLKKLRDDGVTIEALEAKLAAGGLPGGMTGPQAATGATRSAADMSPEQDVTVVEDRQDADLPDLAI